MRLCQRLLIFYYKLQFLWVKYGKPFYMTYVPCSLDSVRIIDRVQLCHTAIWMLFLKLRNNCQLITCLLF